MTYIRLALAILKLVNLFLDKWHQQQWMNEGARRILAKQLKEQTYALAKAMAVDKEYRELSDPQLLEKAEKEGWLRD